jgi:hypothetical protein
MNDQLKYGPVKGEESAVKVPMLVTTAETFRAKSGRFVTLNTTTGAVEVADAGETLLFGWAEAPDSGSSTTAANLEVNVIPAMGCSCIFRIPIITGTLTRAMFGKTVDLVRSTVGSETLIQGADLTASGEDCLLIVGGDIEGNHYVDVMFTPEKETGRSGVV